jgi:membrane fusion protein, multidrug efflux system
MTRSSTLAATIILAAAVITLAAQNTQTVDVAPVVARGLARSRVLPGELLPFESVALSARVAGYVRDVLVDRGSLVSRGQVLATIDAPELLAHRAEAEAKLAQTRATHAEAEARLAALQSTSASLESAAKTEGAVAENELVQARKAVDAQAALVRAIDAQTAAAAAAVDAIKRLEAYLTLTAPFDGVITERNVHPGALVGPPGAASALLKLEQTRRLRLVVPVPEADVAGVTRGAAVTFKVPAHPSVDFHGKVARVGQSIDPRTRTMAIELDVDNTDSRLAPGMYPDVQWPIAGRDAALVVPRTSVVTTTERMFVIRVRDGKAEWVDVRRGTADKDVVEVFGALKPGDEVVVRGSDEIREGTRLTAHR